MAYIDFSIKYINNTYNIIEIINKQISFEYNYFDQISE
jgi:hypothetical protein